MAKIIKVCPNCERGEYLYSREQAVIDYPITVDADGQFDYTGGETNVYDEGTEFQDALVCTNCLWEGQLDQLIDGTTEDDEEE